MTDVAMYEARSEGQQKQAEMWVLGCQPNSAPNKAIHPLPYQPHSTHISDVCLCDGQLLRDSKRYLREVQTSAVSSVNVQAPFRIYPRSDTQQLTKAPPHQLHTPSLTTVLPTLSFLSLRLSMFTEPQGVCICHFLCFEHPSTRSFSSVQFSRSVVSDSLRPHESQHARPPCPSPTPGVHSDSRPLSQ